MDAQVCNYIGAIAFVTDAVVGVNTIKGWHSLRLFTNKKRCRYWMGAS